MRRSQFAAHLSFVLTLVARDSDRQLLALFLNGEDVDIKYRAMAVESAENRRRSPSANDSCEGCAFEAVVSQEDQ